MALAPIAIATNACILKLLKTWLRSIMKNDSTLLGIDADSYDCIAVS